jgi:hypothetical protein
VRYEIYPQQFLTLSPSEPAPSPSVSFLDLRIFQSPSGLAHCLYDKRREEAFRSIPLVRFPDIRSALIDRCRYGIVQSQFVRFALLCYYRDDFVSEMARLLAILHQNKRYSLHRLLGVFRRSVLRYPSLYGTRSSMGLYRMVRELLFSLLRIGTFRLSSI